MLWSGEALWARAYSPEFHSPRCPSSRRGYLSTVTLVYGSLAGALYGFVRAASVYSTASSQDADELVGLMQSIMRLATPAHLLTGTVLAMFGAYLLIAQQVA